MPPPGSAETWANDTAERNNLGPTQYLLAIATEGRSYYLSADSAGPVPEGRIASIEQDDIAPRLQADDWAGAGIAAADGLEDARSGSGSGAWIVVAVPVAAPSTCDEFRSEVEDVVCVRTPEPFHAVGLWYEDFSQTPDEAVRDLLDRARGAGAGGRDAD